MVRLEHGHVLALRVGGHEWCEIGALSGLSWCASAAGVCTGGGSCNEMISGADAIAADGVIHLASFNPDGGHFERGCSGRAIARNYDETTVAEIRSRTKAVTI